MNKKNPIWLTVFLVAFAIVLTFQITYISSYNKIREKFTSGDGGSTHSNDKLDYVKNLYEEYYIGDLDEEAAEYYSIAGYVFGTGDKYGEYMDPETYSEFQEQLEGDDQGIGLTVIYDNDNMGLEIISVASGSPAEKADVMVGDLITYVGTGDDRQSVGDLGFTASVSELQGEAGTDAEFTVLRGDKEIEFTVRRDHYDITTVSSHMYEDGKTGIIRIDNFYEKTPDDFFAAIEELQSKGAERFVFDLRDNPGGELNSITTILDFLLPEGPIIRIVDKTDDEEVISSDKNEFNHPMAVLTNSNTASAAELFTAALKDYNKAVSVGTTTYGKGSIQSIVSLPDGSGLRISYGYYYPPFSDNYDGVGIEPDVEADLTEEQKEINLYKIPDAEDAQLLAAIDYLNSGEAAPDSDNAAETSAAAAAENTPT